MSTSRASRIGGHALRYLRAKARTGHVVSAFRHGLNLSFDEETDPALVTVQNERVALHPWAVASELPGGARVDESAVAEAGRIRFESGWMVELSSAAIEDLTIEAYAPEEAARALVRLPLLEELLEEERAGRERDPFQREIDAILNRWDATEDPGVLADLVGLGSGSTPSGDDILVGMLAGFTAFEAVSDRAKENLSRLRVDLHKAQALGTHLASAQMVAAAAAAAAFPERLRELADRLRAVHAACVHCLARKVLDQGAMSGFSTLSGFAAAGSLSRRDL